MYHVKILQQISMTQIPFLGHVIEEQKAQDKQVFIIFS